MNPSSQPIAIEIGNAAEPVLPIVKVLLPGGVTGLLATRPAWQRWTVYYGLVGSMIFLGAYYATVQFIYFQF